MKIIVIFFTLLFVACQTIKPYEIVYSYSKEKKLWCSWETIEQKKEVCKTIDEIDTGKFRLFNEEALATKFNDIFKKFNKCLATK
jgi:hypothetical protein